jgi:hypothetical protein
VDETEYPVGESLETKMEGRESSEESKKLWNLWEGTALEGWMWTMGVEDGVTSR